jgi:DNA polymerase-1
MAINTPIQGSAADLIKRAMVRIHQALSRKGFRSRMVLQIHDELLMEVHPEELGEIRDLVRREMEGAAELNVPLVVELGSGRTWWDAHG